MTPGAALAIVAAGPGEAKRAAAAAAALPAPLMLLSPAGASAYGGCGWFSALAALAAADLPVRHPFTWALDCGARAGDALEALGAGVPVVVFDGADGADGAAARLAAVAAARRAVVLRARPPALTLRRGGDPAAACREWLALRRPSETGQAAHDGPVFHPIQFAP